MSNKQMSGKKKLKLFLENFFVYGFGGIISKVIPLIMVPFVTRIMPDSSYYGISDMSNTLISFCSALAVFGMYDAMYRLYFDKEDKEYQVEVCSTTLLFTLCVSLTIMIIMFFLRKPLARVFFQNEKLTYLIYIAAITTMLGGTNSIVAAPTRMQNKRKTYIFMNVLSPLISYSLAIPLLLGGYYFIALPISAMISALLCEGVFFVLNRQWFSFTKVRPRYLKDLLRLAVPIVPNFLIYWIFNSSDRLMITNLIGTDATGIYSVGAKLGLASQLVYTAFAGGWQYFAFSTMNEENQVESNSHIFEYLGIISYISTFFICLFAKPLYKFLFVGEYVESYVIAPYLYLAPLLLMLFQIEGNQFLVVKKTWPSFFILISGAVVNIILNLGLIPLIGIEGAAIATLIGYIVSVIVCTIVLIQMKLMVINKRFLICSILMGVFFVIWRLFTIKSFVETLFLVFAFTSIYLYVYRKEIAILLNKFLRKMNIQG